MIPEKVQQILEAAGLEALQFEPGSTPTAATAAEKIGVTVGQIAKSILMRGKDGVYRLFVLTGDRRVSSSKVKQQTGVKHSMCPKEETYEVTGFKPGGVCPYGLEGNGGHRIEIYIDRSLERYDTVYPAAGDDASGVPTTFRQLLDMTGGKVSDVAGE
jgi:prolyl-tRNA editing enzyme YbaK/EbsC (Cys-tRNA(Pro) deacylase)